MLKLLIARPSPFARKARVALREKGIAHEEIIDNPWLPGNGVAANNPLGKVPVLFLADGTTLHDSKVIIGYLETLPAKVKLLPPPGAARVAHRQIEAVADGVCDAVVLLVLERARSVQSAEWNARQMKKVEAGCAMLEQGLRQAQRQAQQEAQQEARQPAQRAAPPAWLVEDSYGLADIATGCALGYLDLRLSEFDWRTRHPQLAAFFAHIDARPAFAATRPEAQAIPQQ